MLSKLFLALCFCLLFYSTPMRAQQTIDDAVALVKAITDSDPNVQDRKRAEKAVEIVRTRVEVLNDFSGTFLQTLPVDFWNYFKEEGNIKTRAEVISVARAKGWSLAEVAWLIKGGQCDEHASLMQMILRRAGVTNVKILRSNSPHAFPVVNLADDYDPDNPWTWGEHAFVPDSWSGAILNPIDTWYERHNLPYSIYFKEGEYYVNNGTDTTREKLKKMMGRGRAYLQNHCTVFHVLLQRFLRYPVDIRQKLPLKPPLDLQCSATPKLILLEKDFEVVNPGTHTFEAGNRGNTPTSNWQIKDGYFHFESRKDDFQLEIFWDQIPDVLQAVEPVPFAVSAVTKGGPRSAQVAFTPVMDITGWRVEPATQKEEVQHVGVNAFRLTLKESRNSGNTLYREDSMQLLVTPVGRDASIRDGKVTDGSGVFFKGKKPGEFDAYFLELNCNGIAKARWTYVPEGSPHLKSR